MKQKLEVKEKKSEEENVMRKIFIEKVVLSCGAVDKELEKSRKLLELISGMKAQIIASSKRIPEFGVSPGMQVGTRVTLRKGKAIELLKRLLGAADNTLSRKQISDNHFSFGIKEYIEITGLEYQRDIGIKGLNVTVVLTRSGLRVKRKKIKSGEIPKKQYVSKDEIIKYMGDKFKTNFLK